MNIKDLMCFIAFQKSFARLVSYQVEECISGVGLIDLGNGCAEFVQSFYFTHEVTEEQKEK